MSTTLWLCEHNWVQTCADCDFYPCIGSDDYEDPYEPNDCDEFCHSDGEDGEEVEL